MAFSPHDVVPDSPINNFATLNPLHKYSAVTLSNGNLNLSATYRGNQVANFVIPPTGKWYWEGKGDGYVGSICDPSFVLNADVSASAANALAVGYWINGYIYDGINSHVETGHSYTSSNIIGICVDFDSATKGVSFYRDGVLAYTYNFTGSNRTFPNGCYPNYNNGGLSAKTCTFNFGQDPTFGGATNLPASAGSHSTDTAGASTGGLFAYQPPAGALALCTKNLPSGPIDIANDDVPADYFKVVTWTGANNNLGRSISVGFQPDLVWTKARNIAYRHLVFDSVRGAGSQKELCTNETFGESGGNTNIYDYLSSFDAVGSSNSSGGFSSTWSGNSWAAYFNETNKTYVAWCWKAAGAPADNQARIIDTDGTLITKTTADLKTETGATITPAKVSANRKSGFSIVKYTGTGSGATVPHGLSAAPEFMLVKPLDTANSWVTYDKTSGGTNYMALQSSQASSANSTRWGNADPTSKVFSIGNHVAVSDGNKNHIAYCWHSVPGYSKFGSYVGNGSADGPFIELGFRPAWVMIKSVDSANDWILVDTVRFDYNIKPNTWLAANQSYHEGFMVSGYDLDILSNGFKIRASNGVNSGTWLYAAFAEAPMNAPSNAR